MERLSVITALVGLLAVGGKTIDILWEIDAAPGNESAFLNQALQAVKQCRSSLHVLYSTLSMLETTQLPFPERAHWLRLDSLIAVLTDTVLAVGELQVIAEDIDGNQPDVIDYGAVRRQYGAELESLCSRIRWLNLSFSLMMTILKCPAEEDAQNSRLGLDQRVHRLLASRSQLSSRMSSLQDAFEAVDTPSPALHSCTRRHINSPTPSHSGSEGEQKRRSGGGGGAPYHIWSAYSGYTLADIPVLSIIMLPVTTDELRDGYEVYTFAFAREARSDTSLIMHAQTGSETYKLRNRNATTAPVRGGNRKKWKGIANVVQTLGRRRRRKRGAARGEGDGHSTTSSTADGAVAVQG